MSDLIAILIDDETDIRELLAISLSRMGYECLQAGSFKEGQNLIDAAKCDLCLTDVRMPDGSGIDLVRQFRSRHPNTPVAVMTAFDTTEIAIEAMKAGAFDFLAKPIRAQRLENLIKDAKALNAGATQLPIHRTAVSEPTEPDRPDDTSANKGNIDGPVSMAALSMAPVLITGEPGTGKGFTARNIHEQSQRAGGPFLVIDCASVSEEDLENVFFGRDKPSSEESKSNTLGLFDAACSGGLLLKNIDSLPLSFQRKLVRCLVDRTFKRTGEDQKSSLDIRVFCSANLALKQKAADGSFRKDLYDYLSVIEIETLPLRERLTDIQSISNQLLAKITSDTAIQIDRDAIEALKGHSFQNNISELWHILKAAADRCVGNRISTSDLFLSQNLGESECRTRLGDGVDPLEIKDLEGYLSSVENEIITAVLTQENWNRTQAAKRLGLTTRQFRYKLAKYGLSKEDRED